MRRPLSHALFVALALGLGCARPAPPPPSEDALLPGDVVRPQIEFAPKAPWRAGAKVALGMLLRVERPGREGHSHLSEADVPGEGVSIRGSVTFFRDGVPLGEPLAVPFVKDC